MDEGSNEMSESSKHCRVLHRIKTPTLARKIGRNLSHKWMSITMDIHLDMLL